jgi:hypothetical protein
MQHVWTRRELYTGFWWGNLKAREHVKHVRVDDDNSEVGFKELVWEIVV